MLRVGLVKAVPQKWDLEGNWTTFEHLTRCATERGAQLVCTPECFLDGYVAADNERWTEERFYEIGQPLTGEGYLRRAMAFAKDTGIHLVFGFTERAEGGCYNAAALIDDQGQVIGCYHKTHLLDHDERFLPGEEVTVWETSLGKVGIMICADRRWPETARTLKIRGAEIIVCPSYGMWHLDNEWWMRTRGYENEVFVCFVHPHVALITDPRGEVAAKLQSNIPEVLVHDIDLSDIPDRMFRHRRPDIYAM